MELPGYREQLEAINEKTKGKIALTVKECADILSIHLNTVYSMLHAAKNPIPFFRVGGKIMISTTALARWMCVKVR